jgi:hypothetical protein
MTTAYAQQNTVSPSTGVSNPTGGTVACPNGTSSCNGSNVSLLDMPSSGVITAGFAVFLVVLIAAAYVAIRFREK